jgi:hypothetical protein
VGLAFQDGKPAPDKNWVIESTARFEFVIIEMP